jgi:hypothetical protein
MTYEYINCIYRTYGLSHSPDNTRFKNINKVVTSILHTEPDFSTCNLLRYETKILLNYTYFVVHPIVHFPQKKIAKAHCIVRYTAACLTFLAELYIGTSLSF